MKSSFCIDLQRFMLIPTKFPLSLLFSSTALHMNVFVSSVAFYMKFLCLTSIVLLKVLCQYYDTKIILEF